jgi:hypothetical protein
MKWKWTYLLALSYGLFEIVFFQRPGPFLFFFGCGITHLAIKGD